MHFPTIVLYCNMYVTERLSLSRTCYSTAAVFEIGDFKILFMRGRTSYMHLYLLYTAKQWYKLNIIMANLNIHVMHVKGVSIMVLIVVSC